MQTERPLVLVFALVATAAGHTDRSLEGPPVSECRYGPTNSMDVSVSEGETVRHLSVASLGEDVLVAGNDVAAYSDRPLEQSVIRLATAGGKEMSIGLPDGDFLFAFPLLAVEPRESVIHLIWGEFAPGLEPPTYNDWNPYSLASLWHARHGEFGWSEPQLLYEGYRLYWGVGRASLLLDDTGVLHVSFGAVTRRSGGQMVMISVDGLVHDTSAFPIGGGAPAYVSLAAANDSTMVAAAIGRSVSSGATPSLYLFSKHESKWDSPRRLPVHLRRQAMYLNLVVPTEGSPRLIWARSRNGLGWPSELVMYDVHSRRHTVLGRSSSGIHAVTARLDRCGVLHVLYRDLNGRAHYGRGPSAGEGEFSWIVNETSSGGDLMIDERSVSLATVLSTAPDSTAEIVRIRRWKIN